MDLRRIAALARKEMTHVRRDRMLLRMAIVLPIVQLFLIGYAAQMDVDNIPTAICDEDRSPASRELARLIEAVGYFRLVAAPADHRHIQRLMDGGRAKVGVIVPRGYQEALLSGRDAQVGVVLDGADATTARIAASYLQQMLATESLHVVYERLERAGMDADLPPLELRPSIWYNPELRSRHFMIPGVIGVIILTLTLSFSALGIVREREIGTLERLTMAPIGPGELIIGKLMPYLAIAVLDGALALVVAHFWFELPCRGSVLFLYSTILLFAVNTLGLGLFVSSLARTQQQAMLTNIFVIMPSILMSGFIAPISNMPQVVQYLTCLIPLRYFVEIARGVCLKGLTPLELWPQLGALSALTVIALVAGALMLRRRL